MHGTAARGRNWRRVAAWVAVALAVGGLAWRFGDELSLARLAERESQLREYQQQHPLVVYAAAFGLYVAVTALSVPGATGMTLVLGWLLGVARGTVLVSCASTAGATLAFLLSRYLLREPLERRYGERLRAIDAALERDGAAYLFSLRLIPAVPFFLVNVLMGLTRLRWTTFWWVSQLGMLPATVLYVYAGAQVPDLKTLAERGVGSVLSGRLLLALVLLAVFPWVAKGLGRWWGAGRSR